MKSLHRWDLTPREAVALQSRLRDLVRTDLVLPGLRLLAGVDVAYEKDQGQSVASVVVLSYPELTIEESAVARVPTPFPYVPGLLSFREIPPILKALQSLRRMPELILVDGHGRAHPRRMGIASHLGLWLGRPTIGIGKSRLCGEYRPPAQRRGATSPLIHQGEVIGTVLRTRSRVQPIFVSVGYGLPLAECVEWALRLSPRFRIPEPIRQADRQARISHTLSSRGGGDGRGYKARDRRPRRRTE